MSPIEVNTLCVVGGSGFVGSHVVAKALDKGWKVNATMRDANDEAKAAWLNKIPKADGNLKLFSGNLDKKGSFGEAIKGCEAVIVCALPESPSAPELIETVRGGVEHILASCTEHGVKTVVITSSGGSTNPKDGDPPLKKEMEHFSDADWQISKGKYSPAAKTLMEKSAFKHAEEHPEMKIAILNPNLIVGPMFQPDIGGSLSFLLKIVKGERFEKVPNGSMSIIDVRDLADLELAALVNPEATGRYFGVLKSFHWKDILDSVHKARPEYVMPELGYKEGEEATPTQFDMTRRDSLGVKLRTLDEIISQAMEHLKERGLLA